MQGFSVTKIPLPHNLIPNTVLREGFYDMNGSRIYKVYARERAVEYAREWALYRNPLFADFSGIGGNCTNFASQCVLAGSCTMNYTLDYGWYYLNEEERAPAWAGVDYFYRFLTGDPEFLEENGGVGPFGRAVSRKEIEIGDVIQFRNEKGVWYHSVVVSAIGDNDIFVCAQTDDALDRPLSSYNYAEARFLHIEGVRIELNDDECFRLLLRGTTDSNPGNQIPE